MGRSRLRAGSRPLEANGRPSIAVAHVHGHRDRPCPALVRLQPQLPARPHSLLLRDDGEAVTFGWNGASHTMRVANSTPWVLIEIASVAASIS